MSSTADHSTSEVGLVVVGVDGSDQSIEALKWALDEARIRGARVRAMNIWNYPAGYGIEMSAMAVVTPEFLEKAALTTLDTCIEKATAAVERAPLVERVARQGSPSRELLHEGQRADLLVVGQRGHGGFMGLLLGSVANQVLHHATCPTVVVPRVNKV
jgi:nucleotide-binding universal stress UspA family protein